MEDTSKAQRLVDAVAERSGVDAASVERVLEILGLPRLVEKLTALETVFGAASNVSLGPIAASAEKIAEAVRSSALRLENLKLEYRIEGVPHGDGLAGAVAE